MDGEVLGSELAMYRLLWMVMWERLFGGVVRMSRAAIVAQMRGAKSGVMALWK